MIRHMAAALLNAVLKTDLVEMKMNIMWSFITFTVMLLDIT